jgi:hypothetical protein
MFGSRSVGKVVHGVGSVNEIVLGDLAGGMGLSGARLIELLRKSSRPLADK